MSGLYGQLTEAVDLLAEDCAGSEPLTAMHSAIQGVVLRHKPEPCVWCSSPTHKTCSACGRTKNHPCEEIRDIAEKLGITEGAT